MYYKEFFLSFKVFNYQIYCFKIFAIILLSFHYRLKANNQN
jgi:hypothetical protein